MKIVEVVTPIPITAGRIGPVYHGTSGQFDLFERGHDFGRANTSLNGFSFTTDQQTAYGYAVYAARKTAGRPKVITASLVMRNPLDITDTIKKLQHRKRMTFGDAKRQTLTGFNPSEYDGIIFRGDGMNPDEYVVFNPNQITMVPPRPPPG